MDKTEDIVYDFIVVGGGAAGFFGAINLARKGKKILILEKFQKVLSKLAISGGGRCNVTHHQFDPNQLITNYPRGQKALLGPFHKFAPKDMISWLENAGVALKIEDDGRMFPVTDSSSTIIDCFVHEATKAGVTIIKGVEVTAITLGEPTCTINTTKGSFFTKNVLVASGSNRDMWDILKSLGHTIIEPTPSLFALNTPSSPLLELSGLSLGKATLKFKKHQFTGPLLLTHFGLSGPCALKLSSFAAREFSETDYKAMICCDFMPEMSRQELEETLMTETKTLNQLQLPLPKRLYESLILLSGLDKYKPLNHIPKVAKQKFIESIKAFKVSMDGKTTHKEEFVTAGGVDLNEVNFSKMQSKLHPQLYFAGEVLNIDGVTGGFNFQAAWTTSYLVSSQF